MSNISRLATCAVLCGAMTFAAASAAAQGELPDSNVTIVVPYPPGGAFDTLARLIEPDLSAALGNPVIIENRGGASGDIGASAVARGEPDGKTLLMVGSSHAINKSLRENQGYDLIEDLAPVASLASTAFVLLAANDLEAASLEEVMTEAQQEKLFYGSGGSGSVGHLAAVMLEAETGIEMEHVPYQGSGPALTAVMGGEVSLFFNPIMPSLPAIESGRAQPIAVTSASRSDLLPDVPTIDEAGYPGYQATAWFGLAAPAGTPAETISALHDAVNNVLSSSELAARLANQGMDPIPMELEEFEDFIKNEVSRWETAVNEAEVDS